MDTNMGDSFFLGRSREREGLDYAGRRSTCCDAICRCCSAPEAAAFIAGRFAQGAWHIKILITVLARPRVRRIARSLRGRRARARDSVNPGLANAFPSRTSEVLVHGSKEFGTAEARRGAGRGCLPVRAGRGGRRRLPCDPRPAGQSAEGEREARRRSEERRLRES